jgi:hypothetical protein
MGKDPSPEKASLFSFIPDVSTRKRRKNDVTNTMERY